MLPFASFFSDELNFEKKWVTPKEGKAAALSFIGFFSSKASAKEEKATRGEGHGVARKEGNATSLPCARLFSDKLNSKRGTGHIT